MSIYATSFVLAADEHEPPCARWVPASQDEAEATGRWALDNGGNYYRWDPSQNCTCPGGHPEPIIYQGSHVNPADDDPRGGSVELAHIPNFCHPAARASRAADVDDMSHPVQYVRLSVVEDPATYHGGQPGTADVVLDHRQVVALRDYLTRWIEDEERW